ncbi:MAG: hypothetical protein V1856_01020 [Candidatus Liptonbacteria bacterium]
MNNGAIKRLLGGTIVILAVFGFVSYAGAASVDTGWIGASSFSGSVEYDCGETSGLVWGQRGNYVTIPNPNLPAGNYSIDIYAHYGYYDDDPQAPQTNETMRVKTNDDSKYVPDLNGGGGMRADRDSCDQIRANRATYTNITSSPIRYTGGPITFEGWSSSSQSLDILRARVYGNSDDVLPQPATLSGYCTNTNNIPRIQLSWNPVANQQANSLLKRLSTGDFGYILQDPLPFDVFSYTDTSVSLGNTYVYRHKTHAQVASNDVTITVNNQNCGISNPQPTADIKANSSDGPIDISYGSSAVISWTSTNASSCTVTPGNWNGTSGSQTSGNLSYNTTYYLNCTGTAGSAKDSVLVRVGTPPQITADIKINGQDAPVTVQQGTSITVSWTSTNASSCTVSPGGWSGTSGSQNLSAQNTTTYNLSCSGTAGNASDSATVNVTNTPQITADIKANSSDGPVTIPYNTAATISWTSTNASSCTVSPGGWTGTSGSQTSGNLTYNTTYYVFCTGTSGGSANDSVVVSVGVPPQITADIKANGQDNTVTIPYNTAAVISWSSQNANSCSVSPGGWTGTSGSQTSGNLTYTQTYFLNCAGQNGGNAQDSVTVTVGNPPQITADIKANSSDGPVTIQYGTSANITWTSTDANSCSVSPGGWTGTSGSQSTPNLNNNTTYYLSCTGAAGSQQDSVQITVQQQQPPTVTITANPNSISQGQSSVLNWNSQNATYCTASSGWSGNKNLSGSEVVYPGGYTTYVITCYNGSGQSAVSQASVSVNTVGNYPSVTLTANPSVINRGQSSVLNWVSQNTTSCYASGGYWSGTKSLSGGETVYPNQTTTYYINCTGQNGQNVSAQATVFVNDSYNLPTVNLTASPTNVNSGQSSNLYWNSQNATTCYATSGWSGNQNLNGSLVIYPTFTTTYTITCTNQYGQATDTETVTVNNYGGTARNLQITKSALNRNLNQTTYSNSIEGQGLDVLEFEIRLRNVDSTAGTVNVQDVLPQELFYVPQSTTVNGVSVADGITSGGLSLGTVNPNEEKIVRFRAVIFAGAAQKFVTNQVNATMNTGVQNAYATVQIKNRGQVLGAADIVTGPDNPVPWVLGLGLLASMTFYFAAFKFHVIKLAGPVLTPYEKLIYALRDQEKLPDTARAKPAKHFIR